MVSRGLQCHSDNSSNPQKDVARAGKNAEREIVLSLGWSCPGPAVSNTICCDELHLDQDIVVSLPDVSLHVLHVKVNWRESCGLMCFQ